MSDRPRRWPRLVIPLLLACAAAGTSGCICYPRTYGQGYSHQYEGHYAGHHAHDHYYEETAAEIREPEYRAPEPPPPPPRRRRPPEG